MRQIEAKRRDPFVIEDEEAKFQKLNIFQKWQYYFKNYTRLMFSFLIFLGFIFVIIAFGGRYTGFLMTLSGVAIWAYAHFLGKR